MSVPEADLHLLQKLKIAVYCGGNSSEREISLKSGECVHTALNSLGLNSHLIDESLNSPKELADRAFDFVFIALHGRRGEDGIIQKELEDCGLTYTGSKPQGCKNAMDKIITREILSKAGILIPNGSVYTNKEDALKQSMSYPLFVKPSDSGSSIGVSRVEDKSQLMDALDKAFDESGSVIIDKAVSGREIAVGIVGEKIFTPIEIKPANAFYDYSAKYEDKGTKYVFSDDLVDTRLMINIQVEALKAHQVLGLSGFSRVDFILSENSLYCLEANAIPGLTHNSLLPKQAKFCGIQFNHLCVNIIEESLNKIGQINKTSR